MRAALLILLLAFAIRAQELVTNTFAFTYPQAESEELYFLIAVSEDLSAGFEPRWCFRITLQTHAPIAFYKVGADFAAMTALFDTPAPATRTTDFGSKKGKL